jgi:hypothetical protein
MSIWDIHKEVPYVGVRENDGDWLAEECVLELREESRDPGGGGKESICS